MDASVVKAVAALAQRMRVAGASVGLTRSLNAHRALAAVDSGDARLALRASLCASKRDLAIFDRVWAEIETVERDDALDALMRAASAVLPRAAMPTETRTPVALDEEPLPAAYSADELLLHKDFATYTAAERVLARALLARLARRGPRRRSRRTRATRRRGEVHDPRATLRAALRSGGEPAVRRYRSPRVKTRPLVLVVDVSGSMQPYARMLLQYAQACVTARRRVEAFALGTRLTRITRELSGRDPDRALARAAARVVDLGGGTRIGAALGELNRVHGRRLGRGAVVVILSDGWDRGDPVQLAAEMARLRRTAYRLVWMNPLAAAPAYEPLTQGMRAALPHADDLLPGNSLASLAALAELMECLGP
jgi:uncharacterized protein with von Willebrand factor type A (vWA) domain